MITIIRVFFLKYKGAMRQDKRNEFALFLEGDFSSLNIAKILRHLFRWAFELYKLN